LLVVVVVVLLTAAVVVLEAIAYQCLVSFQVAMQQQKVH
jgi:hypothetical protein